MNMRKALSVLVFVILCLPVSSSAMKERKSFKKQCKMFFQTYVGKYSRNLLEMLKHCKPEEISVGNSCEDDNSRQESIATFVMDDAIQKKKNVRDVGKNQEYTFDDASHAVAMSVKRRRSIHRRTQSAERHYVAPALLSAKSGSLHKRTLSDGQALALYLQNICLEDSDSSSLSRSPSKELIENDLSSCPSSDFLEGFEP